MEKMIFFARKLDAIPVFIACVSLFTLMVMTFFDVILRSVFNSPIEAATELTRLLMAITVFAVLPSISAGTGQIAVDLTDGFFRRFRLNNLRDAATYIGSGVMLFWPVKRVWLLANRSRDYGDVTEYLAIPQFYIGMFIAIATGVAAIAMIVTGLLHLFARHLLVKEIR